VENEIIACIADEHIKFLHSGQISKYIFPLERSKAHKQGVSHLIVRFFIIAESKDSGILYLVQKRSQKKRTFPGYYTDSASGHVIYRLNLTLKDIKHDALRELEEEFGIPPKNVKRIQFYALSPEKNENVNEIAYVFLGLVDANLNLFPNNEELDKSNSRFYTKKELISILDKEKSIDYSKEIWEKLIDIDVHKKFNEFFNLNRESTSNDTALFIGRFQPLHHGHIYIINYILKHHNKLKIGIGSSQLSHKKNDPFTGNERVAFITTALEKRKVKHKRYAIYEIPDIFNAQKWVDHVLSIVGPIDIVYSNSDWVRELFINKGYKVGKKLGIFKKKYNSTNIRNLINDKEDTWTKLVPKEVVNLIKKFDGLNRIRSLYNKKINFNE
jgi:nicotinamide-nucleotide adenylyltransferase